MRIVLDANVIVAAFAARGLCESLLELCLQSHEILLSEHLLGEIGRNLRRKIKLPAQTVDQILALLRENGTILVPEKIPSDACRDPDDVKVLGLASTGRCDFLITGDHDLLVLKQFGPCRIVSPREFAHLIHKAT